MMSHDNLTWTARTAVHYLNVEKDDKLVNNDIKFVNLFLVILWSWIIRLLIGFNHSCQIILHFSSK